MSTPPAIRVLVVDDHHVVRLGLRGIQELDPTLQIVGDAASAREALLAVERLRPDVVVLDIRLPDRSGLEVCRDIKARWPGIRVLFLTSYGNDNWTLSAMEVGADGYLLKDNDAGRIVTAIHSAMEGRPCFDSTASRNLLQRVRAPNLDNPLDRLSPLEMKILEHVADGKTDKEVAAALDLQPKTVRNYLDRVFRKMEVKTRIQATLIFIRHRNLM